MRMREKEQQQEREGEREGEEEKQQAQTYVQAFDRVYQTALSPLVCFLALSPNQNSLLRTFDFFHRPLNLFPHPD